MTTWTNDELNKIGNAEELKIASLRTMVRCENQRLSGSSALAMISMSAPSMDAPQLGSVVFRLVMKDTFVRAACTKMSLLWKRMIPTSTTRLTLPT